MADFLDETRNEIEARLKELRPVVEEFNRLAKASAALADVPGAATPRRAPRNTSAGATKPRARRAAKASRAGAQRGRPRGSGARGKQALELVRKKPGITIAELAAGMGIKANYLYRVMPSLEAEGQVTRRDGGWHPAK